MAQFPSHGHAANGGTTQANAAVFHPAPALQGEPPAAGMFRGYEVSAGHPACIPSSIPSTLSPLPLSPLAQDDGEPCPLSERNPRAKRPAQAMEDPASIDPRAGQGDAGQADGKSSGALPGVAKRPFLQFRPYRWSHDQGAQALKEAPEGGTPGESPPVPPLLTAQGARQLLDLLATADDTRFLRDIRQALQADALSRRHYFVDGGSIAASVEDQYTLACALVAHWGGAALSDERLDLIAHELSWQAGLTLKWGESDEENASFLRGVLSAVPVGSDTHTRWILRILQEGFSAAHAKHPAYPLVGRGTLQMLLRALQPSTASKDTLLQVLNAALRPRRQLPHGDARREWEGSDLQMSMAAVRNALGTDGGHASHPLLFEWLDQAGAFSSDELSFLAAGLFTEWPRRESAPAGSADKALEAQRTTVQLRTIRDFLLRSTLKGGRLAAVAFGLVCGARAPRFLLEGTVLVNSVNHASLASLTRGVARVAIGGTGDLQFARRLASSLMQWTNTRAWLPASREDRQDGTRRKRDAVGEFLRVLVPQVGPQALPALVQELRDRVYESQPLTVQQAQQVLYLILPPPAPGIAAADWEAQWQHARLLQLLTADKRQPVPAK